MIALLSSYQCFFLNTSAHFRNIKDSKLLLIELITIEKGIYSQNMFHCCHELKCLYVLFYLFYGEYIRSLYINNFLIQQ